MTFRSTLLTTTLPTVEPTYHEEETLVTDHASMMRPLQRVEAKLVKAMREAPLALSQFSTYKQPNER